MDALLYYIICAVLSVAILWGISLMSKVRTAVFGNLFSGLCTLLAIIVTLVYYDIIADWLILALCLGTLAVGSVFGLILAYKVKMIQMPEMVAMLNGVGGLASAVVGGITMFTAKAGSFEFVTAELALVVGALTFTGSAIAAGKLAKLINGRPVVWKGHQVITTGILILTLFSLVGAVILDYPLYIWVILLTVLSGFFGVAFAIRVGGADMPITISLLNSLSGVAGSIAGMAIGDILLVSVGGIVGASGLLLTQIMCRAMNRKLMVILLGKTTVRSKNTTVTNTVKSEVNTGNTLGNPAEILKNAKSVIIVPGYGMALAQAQNLVKQLADTLEKNGAQVKFAIHPVAGRMPGHMNVLLCEVDVPYEKLYELNDINGDFEKCDACIVVGANDVMNPAARDVPDTPIYGMPILNVDKAKNVIICNYDLKPGYAGVENPLYHKNNGVCLLLGDANKTLSKLLADMQKENKAVEQLPVGNVLKAAKNVIIVPGYGMALAQAQHLVKQLADRLESNGATVKFAIHPVAGRMPGHMNVLLCEVDVPYEKLYEINDINDEFQNSDLCIVIGANDVMNPAARDVPDTPIYGMPILNVDKAKNIIICNYDLKPGYAGVENPLYKRDSGVYLMLGDANKTLQQLLSELL